MTAAADARISAFFISSPNGRRVVATPGLSKIVAIAFQKPANLLQIAGRIKGQTRRPEIFSTRDDGAVTVARWSIIAGAALLVLGVAAAIQTATLFGVTGLIMAGTGAYLVVLGTWQFSSRLLFALLSVALVGAVLTLATSVVREWLFGTEKNPGLVGTHVYWLGTQWWHPLLVVGAIALPVTVIAAANPGRSIRRRR